jgi:hypothetical protein
MCAETEETMERMQGREGLFKNVQRVRAQQKKEGVE